MTIDDIDDEFEEVELDWNFKERKCNDGNHQTYHPALIFSPSGRKPGYALLPQLGVTECRTAV